MPNAMQLSPRLVARFLRNWVTAVSLLVLVPGTGANARYESRIDGSAITITKFTGEESIAIIPDMINGVPVTKIGDNAFAANPRLTALVVPNSIEEIGEYAIRRLQKPD